MDLSNIPPLNGVILILVILAVVYLVFKVASKVIKTVGILLVIGLGWYFWQGGTVGGLADQGLKLYFNNTPISEMLDTYCSGDKKDKARCQCVVLPVHEDLRSRLKAREIKEIDQDPSRRNQEIRISIKNQRKTISECLVRRQGEEGVDKLRELLEQVEIK